MKLNFSSQAISFSYRPSFSRSPSALVFFCLSDPARSTRCSLEWKLLFLWQKQTILLAEVNVKLGKKQSSGYYTWATGLRNVPVIRGSLNRRTASRIAQLSYQENVISVSMAPGSCGMTYLSFFFFWSMQMVKIAWDREDWEFIAVEATVLELFPCSRQDTVSRAQVTFLSVNPTICIQKESIIYLLLPLHL